MPVITKIEAQKHDLDRVNIHLDGHFAFGASSGMVLARGLRVGDQLGFADVEAMRADDVVERSLAASLNFLSYRPRSRREIERYFWRKKTQQPVIEAVLRRLEQMRLLDDVAFARFWVENRQTFRPRGTRALQSELAQKGISSEVADQVLQGLDNDEEDLAYRTGLTKRSSYAGLDEREFFRKMVGFLQRRGFPYHAASDAAKRLTQTGVPEEL